MGLAEGIRTARQGNPLTIRASDVESRVIAWLWRGRLAFGYVTVTTGFEKVGKSTFWCWVIAQLTRGTLDDGPREPVDVVVLANEDGIEDTWNPRLAVAGTDMTRCHFIRAEALGDDWNLRDGAGQLREAITGTRARLLLIDAVMEHLPDMHGADSANSAAHVRRITAPFRHVLRECNVAGVISMHPPKSRISSEFRDMVQTSQAWTAVSRLGLLVAHHPDDTDLDEDDRRRVVLRGVGNRGRNPGALEFRITGVNHMHDDGNTEEVECATSIARVKVSMRDLTRAAEQEKPTSKVARAAALVKVVLRDGAWHDSAEVYEFLDAAEIGARSTVAEAKKLAGAEVRKNGFDGGWRWRLVTSTDPSARARAGSVSGTDPSLVKTTDSSRKNAGSREGSVNLTDPLAEREHTFEGSEAEALRAREENGRADLDVSAAEEEMLDLFRSGELDPGAEP